MIKRCTETVEATEIRLVLEKRFYQLVFGAPVVFFIFKFKKGIRIEETSPDKE